MMKATVGALLLIMAVPLATAQSGGLVNGTRGFPQANGSSGTTINETAIVNSSGQAVTANTSATTVPAYIVVGGAGTTGTAALASTGSLAPCQMDATLASSAGGYYVVNSTTTNGECHPQSAAPSAGTWVIGFLHDQSTTNGSTALVYVGGYFVPSSSGGGGGTTVSINGTSAGSTLNFNNGTPSPGAGYANVQWQLTSGSSSGEYLNTMTLNGTTATLGSGATVPTNSTLVSNSANYYCALFASAASSNQASDVASACTFNPSTGALSTTSATFGALTVTGAAGASTYCVQINSSGQLSNTGATCASGAVNSVSNSDGTLTISPTTGSVVASLALGHANTWTGAQTFSAGTWHGSVIGSAYGGTGIANTATLTLGTSNQNWATLGTGIVKNTTTTGALSNAASSDVISLWSGSCTSSSYLNGAGACTTPSGSGTVTTSGSPSVGYYALFTGSTVIGNGHLDDGVTTASTITSSEPVAIAGSTHGLTIPAGTAVSGAAGSVIYASDATNGYAEVNENNTGLSRVCTAGNSVCGSGGGTTTNPLTMNSSGSGAASGTTFNGSAAQTISYNTIGASPTAGNTSLTTVGTVTTGTWHGTAIGLAYGGTGAATDTAALSNLLGNPTSGTYSLDCTSSSSCTYTTASSGGTVNSGTANQMTYYATSGTAVSGDPTATDNGTTFSYTGTGGISSAGPVVSTPASGVAGSAAFSGNTGEPSLATNTATIIGPNSASLTSYGLQLSATAPAAAGVALIGAPSSSISQVSYGLLPLTDVATEAANTVVGNGTGSTASPTALAVPSCSGATNALTWTSGTGFGCNTISGSGVTWPTSGDVVVSNASNSPAGVAPVNGDCLVGSGGAWTAGSCSGSGGISGTVAANQAVNGSTSSSVASGFTDTAGTITSGDIATYTASGTIGNCTGTPCVNPIGIFNSSTTWISSGETSVNLDATVSVTYGDIICESATTASTGHDNGAVMCPPNETIGTVKTTASSVTSATVFLSMK